MSFIDRRVSLTGALVAAVVVGGASWYLSYRNSPAYALHRIELAIEERNSWRLQQYVDLDRFLPSSVGQTKVSRVRPLTPERAQRLRRWVLDAVEGGRVDSLFEEDGFDFSREVAELTTWNIAPEHFVGLGEFLREGNSALAALRFLHPHLGTILTLQITMERVDGRWIVREVENLDSYVSDVVGLRRRRLEEASAEQKAKAAQYVQMGVPARTIEWSYRASTGRPGLGLRIRVPVVNISHRPIHIGSAELLPHDDDDVALPLAVVDAGPDSTTRLAPGDSTNLHWHGSARVREPFRTGYLQDLEVDVPFVIGEKGSAKYVAVYDSWDEYLERMTDPSGFADRRLETHPSRWKTACFADLPAAFRFMNLCGYPPYQSSYR